MKHYVKVIDGKIVEGPKEISNSESDSPNTNWGNQQMSLNDFFFVDLSHDPMTEKIDYENPMIIGDGSVYQVSYPRIPLSDTSKTDLHNDEQLKKREAEYPTVQEYVKAMWLEMTKGDASLTNELMSRIQATDEKYPLI